MPLYTSKAAFVASDMKACLRPASESSCPICSEDLQPPEPEALCTGPSDEAVQNGTTTPDSSADNRDNIVTATALTVDANTLLAEPPEDRSPVKEDHSPIKVTCCANIFGHNCLEAWLTRENSCPFCRAEFFPSHTVPTGMIVPMLTLAVEEATVRATEAEQAARAGFAERIEATAFRARITHFGRLHAHRVLREVMLERALEVLQQEDASVELAERDDTEDEDELSSESDSEDESGGHRFPSGSVLSEDADDESELEDEDEDEDEDSGDEDSGDEDGGGDGRSEGPESEGAILVEGAHAGASTRG
ncbi:hypothetical protein BKA58DRAFT_2337 [Alternaria rosae]|uniref:uncharacterized protein n=1 Tax=Alternaria rosae TaxID=1187941 RepID=UPI001E8E911B|nr:uncharacterized protein BKA58DRAFT_2337 [Alternaria rosae]KAH6881440.1 hypothetical protein BKA58DRAFT_2337 [Alternaria rosae]